MNKHVFQSAKCVVRTLQSHWLLQGDISRVSLLIFAACASCGLAYAEVVNITQGSNSGYTMTDGNTYVVQESVVFSNATVGGSGMSVESNATVVLYIPNGVTLTAVGANGSWRIGGGAGICVPETATLIMTGEGAVNVRGGNAGSAQNGSDGGNAYVYVADYGIAGDGWGIPSHSVYCGVGGYGGAGGGGGGAAIGGVGGVGGENNGQDGENGAAMGTTYIIGGVKCSSSLCLSGYPGACGASGKFDSGSGKGGYSPNPTYTYSAGGGGGGGGGGAGSAPSVSIGGGGSAGGAGGRGSNGTAGTMVDGNGTKGCTGEIGQGGLSILADGGGSGGTGNNGGSFGVEGGAGMLYVSSTAVVGVEREILSAETHEAAQYIITFEANGGLLSLHTNSVIATLGCALPDCISAPTLGGYIFDGWKDADGVEYYGVGGAKLLSSYAATSNVVLYAQWIDDPDAMVISPVDGTVLTNSLTVSMSSSVEGAVIHYTLDGSEPTADSQIYQKKFRIYGKTIVKAIAICDGWTNKEVVISHYALGRCSEPVIASNRGIEFSEGKSIITICTDCAEGVLRYTTDGSDVIGTSPVYSGEFEIGDTTTIKARVFSEKYFDSEQVELTVIRNWHTVDTPTIGAAERFTGSKDRVVITCATSGAMVYYTLDGSDPTSLSTRYEKPFCVKDSCVIKAVAVKDEYLDSAIASCAVVKEWSIGSTMGACDHEFSTGGDAAFVRTNDLTVASGESMRSGKIEDGQISSLSTTVVGPGTISFKWKTSCEEDELHEYDHAEFVIDGEIVALLDGDSGWQKITHRIYGDGEHTIIWRYVKDAEEDWGEDCMWVLEYEWISDYTETQTTDDPIPYAWLMDSCCDVVDEYDSYENVAKRVSQNGRLTVEQCYVAGLDPESTTDFSASIEMVDGVPHVKWNPDLKEERVYKIFGRESLDSKSDWEYPTNSLHHFFKVTVEIP